MDLKCKLIESLDDLASSRSSLARRSRALDALERVLADICVSQGGSSETELDTFLELQNGFECNVASRLMYSISALLPVLQQTVNSATIENPADLEALTTSRLIIQSMSVLQGIALLHSYSKTFLGRKWCIQTFIDLLTLSRHLGPAPLSSSTNTVSSATLASSGSATLASSTIDTLLCVLVDSPAALRAFEEADGVEVVVKTLKRTGVARDIRIKCLEFLYFYLLDETGEVALISETKHKTPLSLSAIPEGPRVATPFPSTSDDSASSSRSPSPDSCPRTPRKIPRHLGMLRKDVDFVPMTPKKVQVSRLGVGTPHTAPGRTLHQQALSPTKPGRRSPVDISITSASPTKRRLGTESSFGELRPTENQGDRRKSTQEKKEILGSLLGNVDALVEGVSKSGIWGLG